jgi:hypothetical protein
MSNDGMTMIYTETWQEALELLDEVARESVDGEIPFGLLLRIDRFLRENIKNIPEQKKD